MLLLVTIDAGILSIYLTIEGSKGLLDPSRIPSIERFVETKGVSFIIFIVVHAFNISFKLLDISGNIS